MKKRRWLSSVLAILLCLIIATPVFADVAPASEVQDGLVWGDGINGGFTKNTWYSDGRHWVMYPRDTGDNWTIMAESSANYGVTWDEFVVKDDVYSFFRYVACWYDEPTDTIHYVRVGYDEYEEGNDDIFYRMGTPEADGTITWAEVEQDVSTPFGHVGTVGICVDETGYPWVVWSEDDGDPDHFYPVVIVSATNDGTFTGDYGVFSDEFLDPDTDNVTAYIVAIDPVSTDNLVQVSWAATDNVSLLTGIYASFYSVADNWTVNQTVVDRDGAHPLGSGITGIICWDMYDLGETMWCIWTDNESDIFTRTKEPAVSWDAAGEVTVIKEYGSWIVPTLSGYRAVDGSEDLIAIAHTLSTIWFSIRDADTGTWATWSDIWEVPNPESDFIFLHTAQYKYSSPLGFAWDWGDIDWEEDSADGLLYYWWIDNVTDLPGFYPAAGEVQDAGSSILDNILPIVLALSIVVFVIGAALGNPMVMLIGAVTGVIGFYIIMAMLEIL